jgi:S-DNA-T family DNA segregation ATPase FtsK/SpoIIIE
MAKRNDTKLRIAAYRHELCVFFLSLTTLFLFFALYSYNPYDTSWFYYSSEHQATSNWSGTIGSHVAALLMYLFGGASFLFVGLLLSISYVMLYRMWRYEWERIIACIVFIPLSAALLRMHMIDIATSSFPGGSVGNALYQSIHHVCGSVSGAVLLYALLIIDGIIITRFSFMRLFSGITMIIRYGMCKRHLFISWYTKMCQFLGFVVGKPVCASARFIGALLDGTAFEETNLIVPPLSKEVESLLAESSIDMLFDVDTPVARQSNMNQDSLSSVASEHNIYASSMPLSDKAMRNSSELEHKKYMSEVALPKDIYELPNLNIFTVSHAERYDDAVKKELETRAHILQEKLERFGVMGKVVDIKRGPVVTLFEYKPAIDTKLSKIIALEDDLAMALQALSIRIIAPIPGTAVVGFEVANKDLQDVLFADVIQSNVGRQFSGSLPLVLGKDTVGNHVLVDLAKMPHLLIAGSTGSGKSVALNAMLVSLLCKLNPEQIRLILIDPKRLEFASYADIAHLLFPIVTDPRKAAPVLRWVVKEMELRYEKMATCGVRNIFDYNTCTQHQEHAERLPFIVVIIDELADLMMTAGREVEDAITRIAQMARAAGIHMIVATQRPSVDVITGLIKVNFPSRISFRVTSKIDSRTILDCSGADKLLGRGDMLFLDATKSSLSRIHGAYLSNKEIDAVVNHIRVERTVEYLELPDTPGAQEDALLDGDEQLYEQVVSFLEGVDEISISLLQRRFRIGFNKSARIIAMLESRGAILPADGSKTRKVVH